MLARHRGLLSFLAILAIIVPVSRAYAQSVGDDSTLQISVPFASLSADIGTIEDDLNEATAQALATETAIEDLEAENTALIERIAMTEERIAAQEELVAESERYLIAAKERLELHVVSLYKRGTFDSLNILLTSDDFSDLIARANALLRIATDENDLVNEINLALSDARYQQAELNTLQTQNRALEDEFESRLTTLEELLAEQEARVAQLTQEARDVLLAARTFSARTRAQWRAASIPIGTTIPRSTATVDSHPETTFEISAYMPRTYMSTGQTSKAVCSWYGPGFNGRLTASGQIFNQDDYTCASRTYAFGTVLALTRGNHRIIVYVNDRGPYISGRDLDLSKAAAEALGFSGVATVEVEVVIPVQ